MKISEGIRIGSAGRHEITDAYYDNSSGVCAIGALMKLPTYSGNLYKDFPVLGMQIEDDFEIKYYPPGFLVHSIINRNKAGWSFKQIIAWLESIGQ